VPVELIENDRCDPAVIICSGPYADESTAAENCEATGDVETSCCPEPNAIPTILNVALASGIACLDGESFELIYNPSIVPADLGLSSGAICATGGGWVGSKTVCTGKTIVFAMFHDLCFGCFHANGQCGTGDFNGGANQASYTCSPFEAVFNLTLFGSSCGSGTFTATVTAP
jgi:hypothetical protein